MQNILIKFIYLLQKTFYVRPKQLFLLSGCPRSGTSAMRDWLDTQPRIGAMFEPRILLSANCFVNEVNRFEILHANKHLLLPQIRQLVFSYCASTKLVWRKKLIIKEPLESIAFPDKKYGEFVDNMRAVFPGMKILFMVREPLSTIWSMRKRKWGESLTVKERRTYTLDECIQNWIDCADLAYRNKDNPDVYICMFETLIAEPIEESRRIFDFLSIQSNNYFQARETDTPAFSGYDQKQIVNGTESLRKELSDL